MEHHTVGLSFRLSSGRTLSMGVKEKTVAAGAAAAAERPLCPANSAHQAAAARFERPTAPPSHWGETSRRNTCLTASQGPPHSLPNSSSSQQCHIPRPPRLASIHRPQPLAPPLRSRPIRPLMVRHWIGPLLYGPTEPLRAATRIITINSSSNNSSGLASSSNIPLLTRKPLLPRSRN